MPKARAVCRLMINSNLTACITGKSAALFGRRPPCRGVSSSLPASENLHRSRHQRHSPNVRLGLRLPLINDNLLLSRLFSNRPQGPTTRGHAGAGIASDQLTLCLGQIVVVGTMAPASMVRARG
jgi:hypothetical protein